MSKMKLFAKVVHGFQLSIIFAKTSTLDVLNTPLYGVHLIAVNVAFYCFCMHYMFVYKCSHCELFYKKSYSESCFCLGICDVLNNTTSSKKKSYFVASRGTLGDLGVLLKICLLALDIEVFWILIERINSEHPGKIRYFPHWVTSCFPGILRCSFVVFASWENDWTILYPQRTNRQVYTYSRQVNRGVLLNNWISRERQNCTCSEFFSCTRTPEFLGEWICLYLC